MVIGNGFGGVIFHEACGHLLETTSVAKKASVFHDQMGEMIASEVVNAVDNGIMQNEWGSINIDDEGMPTQRTQLIENGKLTNFLVDRIGSEKTGYPRSGSGRRQSYRFAPASRMRNTFIEAGDSDMDDMIASIDKGIYAYVERISPDRNFLPTYGNRFQSNGLRFLHAGGNWDYSHSGLSRSWDTYFYNPVTTLKKERQNPFSGTNPFMRYIDDYPVGWDLNNEPDGKIKYKSSVHGGYLESVPFIHQENNGETVAVYGFSGGNSDKSISVLKSHSPFFQNNESLSLSSGHPIFGLVNYDRKKAVLEHIELNGMHVDFKHIDENAYLVTVRYNDFNIKRNRRLTGNLIVKSNYLDSLDYSLIIDSDVEITIDRSGTPNTHKSVDGLFMNPTEVILDKGSKVLMKSESKLIIKDNSSLILESGAYLKMGYKSEIIIGKNAKFIVKKGARIDKGKKSKITKK